VVLVLIIIVFFPKFFCVLVVCGYLNIVKQVKKALKTAFGEIGAVTPGLLRWLVGEHRRVRVGGS
jgi:hypothetical protein